MVIHLYDGNNCRLREMTKPQMGGQTRLSLRQTYEQMCYAEGIHVWVWDGKNHNERRRSVYPQYKAQREPMAEDHFTQIRLFREVLKHSRAVQVECEGWEADDVVATLARRYRSQGHQVLCHSNDLDYWQLVRDGIQIDGIQKAPCAPRWIPLYKALVGDKSDNIGGIRGFGPGSWDSLEDLWEEIEQAIAKGSINPDWFPKRCRPHIDIDNLQAMLLITHFYEVPLDEIDEGTTLGELNPTAADKLLREYFL